MLKHLQNIKSITLKSKDLLTAVQAISKKRNRITLDIDYQTKTLYIKDNDMMYTLKGLF